MKNLYVDTEQTLEIFEEKGICLYTIHDERRFYFRKSDLVNLDEKGAKFFDVIRKVSTFVPLYNIKYTREGFIIRAVSPDKEYYFFIEENEKYNIVNTKDLRNQIPFHIEVRNEKVR